MRLVLPFRRQVTSAVSLDAEQGSGLKAEEVKRRHILPKALIIGLVAGLISSAFREALQWSEVHRIAWLYRLSPAAGLLAALAVGAVGGGLGLWLVRRFTPEASGSGIPHMKSVVLGEEQLHWRRLLPVKFFGGLASIGGGIFAPLLVIGALGGLAVGRAAHLIAPSWAGHPEVFAVLGMGALLTSIARAPLTGIVLMVELTGKYDYMLPLLVSCFAAYGVAEAMNDVPIYEASRSRAKQRMEADLS